MPVYEYVCRDCGEHVEVVQSFRESPLTTCGVCGGSLRKVFSAAGIIFKGSGYYVTDTRRKEPSSSDDTAGKKEGGKKEGGKKEGVDATTGGGKKDAGGAGKKDAGGGGKGSGSRTAESA
ncbi:MAG: FmdB family transcriptional regulator [Actinobacteria bacterium]|nr:FmdB family transcriptional regulator [Actinomycetota bacterium]